MHMRGLLKSRRHDNSPSTDELLKVEIARHAHSVTVEDPTLLDTILGQMQSKEAAPQTNSLRSKGLFLPRQVCELGLAKLLRFCCAQQVSTHWCMRLAECLPTICQNDSVLRYFADRQELSQARRKTRPTGYAPSYSWRTVDSERLLPCRRSKASDTAVRFYSPRSGL